MMQQNKKSKKKSQFYLFFLIRLSFKMQFYFMWQSICIYKNNQIHSLYLYNFQLIKRMDEIKYLFHIINILNALHLFLMKLKIIVKEKITININIYILKNLILLIIFINFDKKIYYQHQQKENYIFLDLLNNNNELYNQIFAILNSINY